MNSSTILSEIIILSRLRDMIREVSINHFFRSVQHRDEVYKAILDALESLEEELDELREKEYEGEDEEEEKASESPGEEEPPAG